MVRGREVTGRNDNPGASIHSHHGRRSQDTYPRTAIICQVDTLLPNSRRLSTALDPMERQLSTIRSITLPRGVASTRAQAPRGGRVPGDSHAAMQACTM